MTNKQDDPIRDAHAAIVQAIADLQSAGFVVPISLHLAAHALARTTPTPTKSVKAAVNGAGHSGAL